MEEKKKGKLIKILIIILLLVIILGLIYFIFKSNNIDLVKLIKKEQGKETVINNQEGQFVEKTYTFKPGAYCLVDKELAQKEIVINDMVYGNVNAKIINFETGFYNIELIKGDEVNVDFETVNYQDGLSVSFNLNNENNKYEEIYIENTPIDDNTEYKSFSFNRMYILVKNADGILDFEGNDVEIKFTKINKEIGKEPVAKSEESKTILEQRWIEDEPYVVGKDLEPGIYDMISLEEKYMQTLMVKLNKDDDNSRFFRSLSTISDKGNLNI